MSFPKIRQARLQPLLDAWRQVPGVEEVHQDDWDSVEIDVFVTLQVVDRRGRFKRPWRFAVPYSRIRSQLRTIAKEQGIAVRVLDWPKKTRIYIPTDMRFGGPVYEPGPYDQEHLKFGVAV